MLFDDEEVSGRRMFSSKRRPRHKLVLRLNTSVKGKRRIEPHRLAVFVLVPTVAAASLVLLWFLVKFAGGFFYSGNSRFEIATLDIVGGRVMSEQVIRECSEVSEGMNLFDVDIGKIVDRFRRAPNVKFAEVERRLPDKLSITVVEREPLARIWQGREKDLVVDRDGVVFGYRSREKNLPILVGYRKVALRRGDIVEGLLRDAIDVIDLCDRTMLGREIVIISIDVRGRFKGREDGLRLYLAGKTTVDLWWNRGSENSDVAPADLGERMVKLRDTLRNARQKGVRVSTVNLTLDTFKDNCPVVLLNR